MVLASSHACRECKMACLEAEPPSMLQQHLLHIYNSCAFISMMVSVWILFIIQDFNHTKIKSLQKAKIIQLVFQIIIPLLLFTLWFLGGYAFFSLILMWWNQFIFAVASRYRAFKKIRKLKSSPTS
jgi:hypothetical protein